MEQKLQSSADQEIVNSLLEKGHERIRAENLLFTKYAYFIEQAMHKYSFTEEEAFDIYSDTILSAIPKIIDSSFEGRSSLKTWLFQIFHNKCVDLIRKKTTNKSSVNRTTTLPEVFMQVADSTKTIIQELMDRTDKEVIRLKLGELGENCQQLLWKWAEGYSDKEIAETLQYKTADVVKTSRLRCLEKLRQLYKNAKS
ncbi:MAG: sigma-70 family RNA polymerase sigma factor [Chitinophagaceae bacterium]